MKFSKTAKTNGSGLKGYVTTTYSQLVKVFGLPNYGPNDSSGDKVTCEWKLTFADGTIATIYDWKLESTPMGIYDWHIGGVSGDACLRVADALNTVLEMKTPDQNLTEKVSALSKKNDAFKDYIWELERMLEENCIAEKYQMREYLPEEFHSELED
jgi:hypothetical protein